MLKQGDLEPVAQDLVQTDFEYLQTWRLHNLSSQYAPVPSHPQSEKVFLGIQREPPELNLCLLPVTGSCH